MAPKVRSANRRRQLLELPSDLSAQLDSAVPGLADALNDRLKRAAEHLEATAGLRGQVNIANTMAMEDNTISELKDPVEPQDAVNKRYLDKQLECENLVRILEECADFSEALDNENDTPPATGTAPLYFVGVTVGYAPFPSDNAIAVSNSANDMRLTLFWLPFDFTVKYVSCWNVGTIANRPFGVGLYTSGGVLVVNSGVLSGTGDSLRRVTLTNTVLLKSSHYWLASSGGIAGQTPTSIIGCIGAATKNQGIMNSGRVRKGKLVTALSGAVDGVLPSTIDTTLIVSDAGFGVVMVLFESDDI